jgi:hypothetical protein
MAKFTPGVVIGEIRNKIAAMVFTRNKAGAAIRLRITPINRRSTLQTTRRQVLSSLSANWRGLSAANLAAWNAAAANFPQSDNLGQTVLLTGQQLYVRCNANLALVGVAAVSTAPVVTTFATLAYGTVTATAAGTFSIAFTPTPVAAGYNLVVYASRAVSAGKSFAPNSAFKFITFVAAAGTSPVNAFAAYSAIFGALTGLTGQKIFIKMRLIATASGLAGQYVRTTVSIT